MIDGANAHYKIRAGNELSNRKCATGLNATLVVLATVKMLASAPRHNKFRSIYGKYVKARSKEYSREVLNILKMLYKRKTNN